LTCAPAPWYLARVPQNERSFSSGRRQGGRGAKRASSTRTRTREAATKDKRERILRAAIKVFARKGFYATRVSEIAKAAGVADGTIYLYFKNKDDVLISIFEDRIGQLNRVMREEASAAPTVEERIRRVVELQLGLLEDQRDLAEVVTVNLRQSSRLLKQYAAPLFSEYLEIISGIIRDGQKEGSLRADVNPRIVARALWGGLDGLALTWAMSDADPAALRKAAQQFASIFLDGLKA
jgi:TetR/AcrR family transcriptional regulator, fatty acid metabolism regulator protein